MTDFLIAYGSHTGQAETIAGGIREKAEVLGLKPRLFKLDDNEKLVRNSVLRSTHKPLQFNIEDEPFVVIVVSSTGDGDAPDNAQRFVRRIGRRTLDNKFLQKVSYALLGLGDSNYSSYQAVPKRIDKQLTALGATRVGEVGEADDQVGLELAVEPWIEKLFATIAKRFNVSDEKLAMLTETKLSLNPVKTAEEKKALEQDVAVSRDEESEGPRILKAEPYEYPEHSLIKGTANVSNDQNLRVPIAPQTYLQSSVSHRKLDTKQLTWQNECKMVGVVTKALTVTVVGTAILTDFDVKKPKREIVIDLGENADKLRYEPGDAMYFVVPNPEDEVNFVLDRCGVLAIADQECELAIDPKTEKMNAAIPGHVHQKTTLRHLFTSCLDVRRAPGRPVLRILAESASNQGEKRRLLELCSAQGMGDFTNFVRQAGLSLTDVLFAFPSVKPPVDRLIELLPRLIPRPYSMSSYNQKRARFVYSELVFTAEEGRRYQRKGLATDWLNQLRVGDQIQVLGKEPARFRLPPPPAAAESAEAIPLLMVGPGTGVAVFISFCHFLRKLKLEKPDKFESVPRILFFGCRNVEKDGIYIEELQSFVRDGILTDLFICQSEVDQKRVQQGIQENVEKVLPFLESSTNGKIFVCGDAKGMSKDLWECFAGIYAKKNDVTPIEAKKALTKLKTDSIYIEDVWA